MKTFKLILLLLASCYLGLYQIPASAISLEFQPTAQTVNVGDSVSVNVVISGLGNANQIVSAFDLDVIYNPGILTATGVTFGGLLGDLSALPLPEAEADAVLSAGRIDFWELSWLSDAELRALPQPDSFSLATLTFKALGAGATSLEFDANTPPGIDVKGLDANKLTLDLVGLGSVTVAGELNPVPTPATIWLFLLGLIALMKYKIGNSGAKNTP